MSEFVGILSAIHFDEELSKFYLLLDANHEAIKTGINNACTEFKAFVDEHTPRLRRIVFNPSGNDEIGSYGWLLSSDSWKLLGVKPNFDDSCVMVRYSPEQAEMLKDFDIGLELQIALTCYDEAFLLVSPVGSHACEEVNLRTTYKLLARGIPDNVPHLTSLFSDAFNSSDDYDDDEDSDSDDDEDNDGDEGGVTECSICSRSCDADYVNDEGECRDCRTCEDCSAVLAYSADIEYGKCPSCRTCGNCDTIVSNPDALNAEGHCRDCRTCENCDSLMATVAELDHNGRCPTCRTCESCHTTVDDSDQIDVIDGHLYCTECTNTCEECGDVYPSSVLVNNRCGNCNELARRNT